MKSILPAKLVAIILLMASPFVYSASDDGSSCRQKADLGETASVRFVGASSCADVGSVFTGNDHCQVKATPEATCTLDAFGVWVGEPYYFTGCLAGVECSEEPTEPQPPIPLPPMELPPPLAAPVIRPSDIDENNSSSFAQNTTNSLTNITSRLNSLTQYFGEEAVDSRNALQAGIYSINHNISNTNSFVAANADNILNALGNTQQGIRNYSGQLFSATERNADIRATSLGNKLDIVIENQEGSPELLAAIEDVKNNVVGVQNQLYDPMTRDAKHNELLSAINNSSGGGGDGELTVSLLGDISNTAQVQLGETMDGFQAVKSNIQNLQSQGNNNTDRIVNAVNNSTGLVTVTNELQAVGGKLDGLLGQGQGLSQQLGQQLDGIKTAIENGSGTGGGDDDTATNEKLDGLGQKLDGIKGSLDSLSDTSGFADDLADGTAQGKSDLNELLDGYDADTMLTDRFKQITDEAEKTMTDSGLGKFSDPSKFINDSGMVKPESFDDLIAFAQQTSCAPYSMTIHGNSYQMDLCKYASESSAILNYVFASLTAIFCFVMISQTLINERLS